MGKTSVCVMAWQVSFLCQGIQLVSWKNMKSATGIRQESVQALRRESKNRKKMMLYLNAVSVWIVFCKYRSHRILSPYRLINRLLQKSEVFQSVHHVTFILCYTVLYDFFGLRCRFGRHRAEVHWTSCALIRVRKHWWDDITQGKQ